MIKPREHQQETLYYRAYWIFAWGHDSDKMTTSCCHQTQYAAPNKCEPALLHPDSADRTYMRALILPYSPPWAGLSLKICMV